MDYLRKIVIKTGEPFHAIFTSGAETSSHDVACFFMAMQDKNVSPSALGSYIRMGEIVDSGHDWREIKRIAATFTNAKGAAA